MNMTDSLKVTPLYPEDFEDVVNLVVKFAEEEFEHEFDIKAIALSMAHFITKHVCMAVRDPASGDEIVGIFIFDEEKLWWANTPHLYNAIMYVEPQYRSVKLFRKLMKFAEAYARSLDMEFVPSLALVKNLDKKGKVFERLGYEKASASYRKAV